MGEHKDVSNTVAQNAAKNLIENILNEVISTTISNRAALKDFRFQLLSNKGSSDCTDLKEEKLENPKDFDIQEAFGIYSHLIEMSDPSLTNLPEVCKHGSTLSTTSQQGEGDFQHQSMWEANTFYQLGLDQDGCNLSSNQNRKSLSTSSLSTNVSQYKVLEYLDNSLQNLSYDTVQFTENTDSNVDDDHFTEHELVDDEINLPSESISPKDLTESLLLDVAINGQEDFRENCCDAEDSSDCAEDMSDCINTTLQHSQKFCQYNKVQYFPASFEQLPPNYCELVDESYAKFQKVKYDKETEEILSESSEELANVEGDTEMVDSIKNLPSTNPFGYPNVCSATHSAVVLSPKDLPNISDSSSHQTNFKGSTIGLKSLMEETNEVQINVTEPEIFMDMEEDIEEEDDIDLIKTREYWSNTGLITENKIIPTYLGPLPSVTGIESIQGVTLVKETCLKQTVQEDFQLSSPLRFDKNNTTKSHEHKNDDVNFLSYPGKAENKQRKKPFLTRITNSISNVFRSKKNPTGKNKK